MSKKNAPDLNLDAEIGSLRDLLNDLFSSYDELTFEQKLAKLSTAGRTALNMARLLKAQRELQHEETDTAEVLRQALHELEGEWPELRECKENLRSGGAPAGEEAHAAQA